MIKGTKLAEISYGMSEMARTHPNDTIANNLARVAEKVASLGATWGAKTLDDTDMLLVKYYLANK